MYRVRRFSCSALPLVAFGERPLLRSILLARSTGHGTNPTFVRRTPDDGFRQLRTFRDYQRPSGNDQIWAGSRQAVFKWRRPYAAMPCTPLIGRSHPPHPHSPFAVEKDTPECSSPRAAEVPTQYGSGRTLTAVAALPRPEDLLDPAPHTMDRLIPLVEPCLGLLFGARPNACGDGKGNAALGSHGIAKVIAAVGAVGEHLTKIVGQGFTDCLAVIDVGGARIRGGSGNLNKGVSGLPI